MGRRGLIERITVPSAPLGAGWPHLLLARYARQFRHLPDRVRLDIVRRVLGPFGAWWLHDRFDEAIDVRLDREIRRVVDRGDEIVLDLAASSDLASQGESIVVDRVIAATGYQVDLEALRFLDDGVRSRVSTLAGSPRLTKGFESSVPGLFFTGLSSAATFGPVMRFVAGSDFAGRSVAQGVGRRLALR